MKATDEMLKRLFRAAASAPRPEPAAPPFALETRVLATWRSSRLTGENDGVLRFLRIGLGFASVLMIVIIALSLRSIPKDPVEEFAMPKAVLNLALLQ
jgi:hypothetical protein